MAERLKALVLKTSDAERHRGFESLSLRQLGEEKYPSGRRGSPAKGVVGLNRARVQIPASPPNPRKHYVCGVFLILRDPPLFRFLLPYDTHSSREKGTRPRLRMSFPACSLRRHLRSSVFFRRQLDLPGMPVAAAWHRIHLSIPCVRYHSPLKLFHAGPPCKGQSPAQLNRRPQSAVVHSSASFSCIPALCCPCGGNPTPPVAQARGMWYHGGIWCGVGLPEARAG